MGWRTRWSGGGDDEGGEGPGADQLPPHPGRVTMPFVLVPTPWYGRITRPRGRGQTRSERPYLEAIQLLSYVVFMYRREGRFAGDLLHLDNTALRGLFGMTQTEYIRAVRYLDRSGYVTRVIVRGLVPWDPRTSGVYTFVVPRVPKLRASLRRKGKGRGD